MKRRRFLFLCLIVLLICIVLPACGSSPNEGNQSADFSNSSELSIPSSDVDSDDSSSSNNSSIESETFSSDAGDGSEESSNIEADEAASNSTEDSKDDWIDIVFPRG